MGAAILNFLQTFTYLFSLQSCHDLYNIEMKNNADMFYIFSRMTLRTNLMEINNLLDVKGH